MAVIVATKELVDCVCLGAITVYTKAGHFREPVLATVATVRYLHTVRLFHMHQPHKRLHAIVVITRVPSGWYEYGCVGLQETFTQQLIASRRDRYRLDKYVYVPNLHKFASEDSASLS